MVSAAGEPLALRCKTASGVKRKKGGRGDNIDSNHAGEGVDRTGVRDASTRTRPDMVMRMANNIGEWCTKEQRA